MATARAASSKDVSSEDKHYVSRGVSYMPVRRSPFTTLISYINSLRDSNELYDLEIQSRGQVFQAHRLVLAGSSPYFRNVLTSPSQERSVLSVDFDPDLLSLCFDYMYTGSVDVDVRMAGPLRDVCESLGMNDLMNDCSHFKLSKLDLKIENCIEIWDVACCVEDKVRAEKAISMVLGHVEDLMTSPSFSALSYERVNTILSHPDLRVSSPDVRLSSVLEWVRHDPTRTKYLLPLLNVLPLNEMAKHFLNYTLRVEHVFKSNSKARELVEEAISHIQAEHVVVIVGACPYKGDDRQPAVQEMYVMPTSLTAPSQSITTLPSTIHEYGIVAMSVNERQVSVSGLGKKLNEVWLYDYKKRVWCGGGVLRSPRARHCMIEMNGDLYVMGGNPVPGYANMGDCVDVEMRVSGTDTWQVAGSLVGSRCWNTRCCPLGDSDILVCGVWDKDEHATLQVYSTVSRSVTHTLSLPGGIWQWVYGLVVVGDHAIVMCTYNTYICPVTSLRNGEARDIQIRSTYKTPNFACAVVLTEDKRHIVLVGGNPRNKTSAHYTYRARVVDIVEEAGTGWERVESGWTVGRCDALVGVCTGMLPASVMK